MKILEVKHLGLLILYRKSILMLRNWGCEENKFFEPSKQIPNSKFRQLQGASVKIIDFITEILSVDFFNVFLDRIKHFHLHQC